MFCHQRALKALVLSSLGVFALAQVQAQVVINELVQDQRNAGSSQIPDTREFIELYNAGSSSVDLSTWSLRLVDLDSGGEIFTIPLTENPVLAAGDFYVIGNPTGINPALIDFDITVLAAQDVFDDDNNVYELRNGNGELVDALGTNLTFDPQYDFATSEQLAQIAGGYWSQLISSDTTTPQSLGRYIDGRDTDNNGYDFGLIPVTPGASNTLPFVADVVPDVQGMALGTELSGYSSSFVQPTVVDPTVVGTFVKHPVAVAPPQGSKVIAAWDPSGGGNMVASNALTNSFDINAYLDTAPLNVSTGDFEWDVTTYGIGTTDAFFGSPDPTDIFTTFDESSNGNTGVGWVYLREETTNFETLFLIDFNDGGDSLPTGGDWTILEQIDLTSTDPGWHRLAIDYDPATGEVVARFNDQVFMHTIDAGIIGTFYVGFREALTGGVPAVTGPALFQLHLEEEASGDFDGDGDVDGRDFLVWQRGGSPSPLSAEDLALWQSQYGTSPLGAIAAVPEPSTAVLLMLFGGIVSSLSRRNS